MSSKRRRGGFGRWVAVAVLALLALLPAAPAQAHALLLLANPAAGVTVPAAPAALRLTFSELVTVAPTGVSVTGPSGAPVSGSAVTDPTDALTVQVPMPAGAPAGTYTVSWSVLSLDGHPVAGAYRFAVIRATAPLDEVARPSSGPGLLGGAGRVLSAAGALGLVGLAGFPLLVLHRARRPGKTAAADATDATEEDPLARIERRLVGPAAGLALLAVVGTALVLLDTAARVTGQPVAGILTDPVGFTITLFSRTGALLVTRILLLAAAGGVLVLLGPRRDRRLLVTMALGTAGLLTFSLSSHAAAATTDRWQAIGFDAVHLLAAAVWSGGLLALGLALPVLRRAAVRGGAAGAAAAAEAAGALAARFSAVAQVAMVAVLTTGAYAAAQQLTGARDLVATAWGAELAVKVALWLVVLVIAAGNAWWIVPRLASRTGSATRRLAASGLLGFTVRLELTVAACLIGVAAWMSATAQPAQEPGHPDAAALALAALGPRTAAGSAIAAGFQLDVRVERTGTGAATGTTLTLGLRPESLNSGAALPGPDAVAVLRSGPRARSSSRWP